MPPPKGVHNPLAGPGDDYTKTLHSDTYEAIDSSKANLHGKNVFICGASKGIGRSITLSFAKAGASCIAIGARSEQALLEKEIKDAAAGAKKSPPKLLQIKLDVTDQKSIERAAANIENQFGRLDVLVHNAGIVGTPSPIVDSDPEDWWKTWDVNVRGPYLVTRAFLPLMLKGGDKQIVNVSSVGAFLTGQGLSSYQASKLALIRFTEFIVSEYGENGVLAFCIHPGNIPGTDILGPGGVPDSLKHIFTETTELPADTIVYLTQEKRDWLAGRYINCTWDMPELMAKKDEIIKEDKLKIRLVRHLGTAYEAHHAKQINIGSRKKNLTLRSIAFARTTPKAIAVPARTILTELIKTKRL
ncbi:hypothetical protein HO133_001742 [Letharia lupina]|uniref:Uncharacterized protein n=1 Tax=Letharia lupina TaxID=560253 RepID=A0A8H6CE58_9LECA|nr:uncharacterized protein HO133_001742 [Letharia lupina]KAF6221774.1 hypothetical protein HO133_001742 [Letharia lupina]